jgi:hypothetical protein
MSATKISSSFTQRREGAKFDATEYILIEQEETEITEYFKLSVPSRLSRLFRSLHLSAFA